MFATSTTDGPEVLMDWHEVAALRSFTTLSDLGQSGLIELVAVVDAQRDALTAQLWQVIMLLVAQTPTAEREFLADEIAAALNVHPTTGKRFVLAALGAHDNPVLLEALQRGEIGERHVLAALEVLTDAVPAAVRAAVARKVVARLRVQATQGLGWPTPGLLRQALRRELLRHDPAAAQEREQQATERRGIHLSPLPDGQAALSLHGPAAQVFAIADALRAHATAPRAEGDTRTLVQREFDAAFALLTGGNTGDLRIRGLEGQVLVPVSVTTGGDLEVAELAGYGPILPSTARDLLTQADSLRRVCVDATTGAVLAVDDPIRIRDTDRDTDRDAALQRALALLHSAPVQLRDLRTDAYRPTRRLTHQIRLRDRTCTFPGCTTPATGTDLDHRVPWPRGETTEDNLHCLCRHHHRAKQTHFTVTQEPDGTTTWTSNTTGKTYRRPPPDWG